MFPKSITFHRVRAARDKYFSTDMRDSEEIDRVISFNFIQSSISARTFSFSTSICFIDVTGIIQTVDASRR